MKSRSMLKCEWNLPGPNTARAAPLAGGIAPFCSAINIKENIFSEFKVGNCAWNRAWNCSHACRLRIRVWCATINLMTSSSSGWPAIFWLLSFAGFKRFIHFEKKLAFTIVSRVVKSNSINVAWSMFARLTLTVLLWVGFLLIAYVCVNDFLTSTKENEFRSICVINNIDPDANTDKYILQPMNLPVSWTTKSICEDSSEFTVIHFLDRPICVEFYVRIVRSDDLQ